jgi:hypothetical protein
MFQHEAAHSGRQRADRSQLQQARLPVPRLPSRPKGLAGAAAALGPQCGGRLNHGRDHRADIDVSPSLASYAPITPATGRGHFDRDLVGFKAGNRLVAATASPGFFSHWPRWLR